MMNLDQKGMKPVMTQGRVIRVGRVVAVFLVALSARPAGAQQRTPENYDEGKVGSFAALDPLIASDGRKIDTPALWWQARRPEILALFESQVYGKVPAPSVPIRVRSKLRSEDTNALGGTAIRREIVITLFDDPAAPEIDLLLYLPKTSSPAHPAPAFLGLNFNGNHAVQPDPKITLSDRWMRSVPQNGIVDHHATEASRGVDAANWPADRIVARGFALATVYYGDIDPDYNDGFQNGVHPYFYRTGQTSPDPDQWGSIAAWAWGLSRVLDVLEKIPEIDSKKVAVMGHSRLGKTALWAGAQDARFAIVISNNSGCGGAALSRRIFGETVQRINTSFPHWFCGNFKLYNDHEERLPVDQHELIALIAPRPVLVSSAEQDRGADPKGEFLSAKGADTVYRLLGTDGLSISEMPKPTVDSLVLSQVGYRYRPGRHTVTSDDWDAFMRFATHHYGKLASSSPKK
jgi:hypothetical protein